MTDPSGLILGYSDSDGVPVIYDPKDNVLIVRDTRPNAPDGGTAFNPDLSQAIRTLSTRSSVLYQSVFTAEDLADGGSKRSRLSTDYSKAQRR